VPSAGDWALDRFAAVFLQGTENVTVSDCTFERVDGNAVMVSGYNRNATIVDSDFAFIGGNAIAAWGYTNETEFDPGRPGIRLENYPEAGIDGTDVRDFFFFPYDVHTHTTRYRRRTSTIHDCKGMHSSRSWIVRETIEFFCSSQDSSDTYSGQCILQWSSCRYVSLSLSLFLSFYIYSQITNAQQ